MFLFSSNYFTNVVTQSRIANVLALEEVLGDYLVYFLFRVLREPILFHVKLDDALVGH